MLNLILDAFVRVGSLPAELLSLAYGRAHGPLRAIHLYRGPQLPSGWDAERTLRQYGIPTHGRTYTNATRTLHVPAQQHQWALYILHRHRFPLLDPPTPAHIRAQATGREQGPIPSWGAPLPIRDPGTLLCTLLDKILYPSQGGKP